MKLLCGKCGNTLNVVWDQAGRACRCPHCGHTIHMPATDDSLPPADERYPDKCAASPQGAPGACGPVEDDGVEDDFLTKAKLLLQRKLLVVCGSCGERLTVEQRLAGKVLRCPACGGQIHIPLQADEESFPEADTRMEVLDITTEESPSPIETAAYLVAEPEEDAGGGGRRATAIVLIVMTGLAGVAIGYILRGRSTGKPPDENPPISTVPARPKPVPATQPIRPTTKPAVGVTTKPVIPPPKPQAAVEIPRAKTGVPTDEPAPAPLGKTLLPDHL